MTVRAANAARYVPHGPEPLRLPCASNAASVPADACDPQSRTNHQHPHRGERHEQGDGFKKERKKEAEQNLEGKTGGQAGKEKEPVTAPGSRECCANRRGLHSTWRQRRPPTRWRRCAGHASNTVKSGCNAATTHGRIGDRQCSRTARALPARYRRRRKPPGKRHSAPLPRATAAGTECCRTWQARRILAAPCPICSGAGDHQHIQYFPAAADSPRYRQAADREEAGAQ